MNYANDLIAYLGSREGPCVITIAPNAPPVARDQSGLLGVAFSKVLDSADVADSLMSLRMQSGGSETLPSVRAGCFSFGVKNLGRFRVHYLTQRGTKVVRIARIPFMIPALEDVCVAPDGPVRLAERATGVRAGLIAVTGPSETANATFVYSLLRYVNDQARTVICTVEPALTFLMSHGNSLVIQCEVGTDAATLEEAVQNAMLMDPSIVYVGGLRFSDQSPLIEHSVDTRLTILCSEAMDAAALVARYPLHASDALAATVSVRPAPGGKLEAETSSFGIRASSR